MSRWDRLFQYGKLYKKQILIGLSFLFIAVATDIVGPLIISYLIDKYFPCHYERGVDYCDNCGNCEEV